MRRNRPAPPAGGSPCRRRAAPRWPPAQPAGGGERRRRRAVSKLGRGGGFVERGPEGEQGGKGAHHQGREQGARPEVAEYHCVYGVVENRDGHFASSVRAWKTPSDPRRPSATTVMPGLKMSGRVPL